MIIDFILYKIKNKWQTFLTIVFMNIQNYEYNHYIIQ
ncbi:hypothetical protein MCEME17_00209 [Candidatus Pelagibacterales bacterium]